MEMKIDDFIYDKGLYITPEIIKKDAFIDDAKIKNLKFSKQIESFIKTMKDNYSLNNLTTMYNNLETVIIKPYFRPFNIVKGEYNCKENIISVSIFKPNAIYHELMHMASTVCNNERIYSGFSISGDIYHDFIYIGHALNEGFTQLYTKEHFNSKKEKYYYPLYTAIADFIKWIIGNECCSMFYLQSNLSGLINELEKYISFDEIITFIRDLDIYDMKKRTCLPLIKEIYHAEIKEDEEYMEEFLTFLKTLKEKKILNNESCKELVKVK